MKIIVSSKVKEKLAQYKPSYLDVGHHGLFGENPVGEYPVGEYDEELWIITEKEFLVKKFDRVEARDHHFYPSEIRKKSLASGRHEVNNKSGRERVSVAWRIGLGEMQRRYVLEMLKRKWPNAQIYEFH